MNSIGADSLPPYLIPYAAFLIPEKVALRRFYKCLGYLARIVAVAVATAAQVVPKILFDPFLQQMDPEKGATVILILGPTAIFISALLFMTARRFLTYGAVGRLSGDARQPILYLRSFTSDVRLFDRWLDFFALFVGHDSGTYESALAKATNETIGPLVAIGKPGETLPPSGAARLYVDNDHWQVLVAQLIRNAKLVVLRIGRTSGFQWEFRHVVEQCDPQKVAVFLPARDRRSLYAYLRQELGDILPEPLPSDSRRALILTFGPNWKPRFIGGPATAIDAFIDALGRYVFNAPEKLLREALFRIFPEARGRQYELSVRFEQAAKIATGWHGDETCDVPLREFAHAKFTPHPTAIGARVMSLS
jgi:hypothetical protein